MQAFLWKIIAFIVSVLLPFLNIPIEFEPVYLTNSDVAVIDSSHGINMKENERCNIFYSYDEFMLYCSTLNTSDEMKEYAETIDKAFFKDKNLVIIDVARANAVERVYLNSAVENGTTLSLGYTLATDLLVGIQVICCDSICVKTSKLINEVEITSREKVHLPFYNVESCSFFSIVDAVKSDNPEEEIDLTYVFEDYESWQIFLAESGWKFSGYTEKINEELFESNNLGLVFSPISNSATETRIADFNPYSDEKEMELICYNVSQPTVKWAFPYFGTGYNAVFIKTSKATEAISATYIDCSVPFMLDRTLPIPMR
ncbi:MAG: hypothetical protein IJD78_08645 [Clostridia bacterium]|nr:hypothetical protein [Clostridia bacterium]